MFKTPDLTPGVLAAGAGIICQLTGLPETAKENITTLAISVVAGDTAVRIGRQKWVANLMADRDKSGTPDILENIKLAWWLAFAGLGLFVATLAALLIIVL